MFYHGTSFFITVKQDVERESRLSSENSSFCEKDGLSVVNPVLGLKPTLSPNIGFCCETGCTVVQQDPPAW